MRTSAVNRREAWSCCPLLHRSQRSVRVGLAGAGEGLARRAALLAEAGVEPVPVEPTDRSDGLQRALRRRAGRERSRRALAAGRAAQGVLVNVEDVPELCDFHVPAIVRRGDLVLTVSTGGRAPGLSRLLREWLERVFGPEWTGRLDEVAARPRRLARGRAWRRHEVSERTRDLVAEKGWLP